MIKGYVKIVNQTSYTELPEPLEWEIVRADKADRDSFYYVFPFDPALRQTLSSAVAFQLKDGTPFQRARRRLYGQPQRGRRDPEALRPQYGGAADGL
jgi:hypothetical protein